MHIHVRAQRKTNAHKLTNIYVMYHMYTYMYTHCLVPITHDLGPVNSRANNQDSMEMNQVDNECNRQPQCKQHMHCEIICIRFVC